jgi:thiamine biosynthesis lipoprotein
MSARLISRDLRGMNTDLRLTVRVDRDSPALCASAEAALDGCADWLTAMERACSRFLPESELCALNASAGAPFIASEDLFAVVSAALEAAARTNGLFDPTILPALHAAGYSRTFDAIAHREVESAWRLNARLVGAQQAAPAASGQEARLCALGEIMCDPACRTITLPVGVALDLGGIAKGWAADELAQRFLTPFPAFLIDLGGDLRVLGGPAPGRPWILGIGDPRETRMTSGAPSEPTYVAGVALSHGGIATSGDARRWWRRGGERMHHLIDPRTRRPAAPPVAQGDRRVLTYTALAPTTAEADVLAKVAFLRGYPDGLRSLAQGTCAAGVCVFADGSVEATPNLEEYLHAVSTVAT